MKQYCERHTAPDNEYAQWVSLFTPKRNSAENFRCDLFLENNEKVPKNIANREGFVGKVQSKEIGD
ncbi:MAG TPA: hypothetical protein VIV55_09980 [Flavobacterium sp.]